MKLLGLDIGTTSISAVVTDGRAALDTLTLPNDSAVSGTAPFEKLQDPEKILETARKALSELLRLHPDVVRIGITGQMHGIVYTDSRGRAVSPLYTWQDRRGDIPDGGSTSVSRLSALTGYRLAAGYGSVTHYYNTLHGLVPQSAVAFSTIHDHVAMRLCGLASPLTDAADAASLGLFDLKKNRFDREAILSAGMDPGFYPEVRTSGLIGLYDSRIPVYCPTGDNQASFLGATGGKTGAMLVNIGTGGQFSVLHPDILDCPGLETRPFPGGGFLIVGASLCGGSAYALLERFFRSSVSALSAAVPDDIYAGMDRLLSEGPPPDDLPAFAPFFAGTRSDPKRRASLSGLNENNFTPRHLIWALLFGMAKELHDLYECCRASGAGGSVLFGSGNGLRRNAHLRRAVEETFGLPLVLSSVSEEAAFGAALLTLQ